MIVRVGYRVTVAVVIAVAAFATLVPAAAAKPFTLKPQGQFPHLAVDEGGTGHVVWNERVIGGDDVLHYCRLPRGTKSCAPERTFTLGGIDFEGPRALIGNGVLTLVTVRCCFPEDRLMIMQSSNGGQSFSSPAYIARPTTLSSFSQLGGGGDAALGPGAFQLSTASSGTGGSYFQAAPMSPGAPVSTAAQVDSDVPGSTADTTNASVAFADPLSPVVAFEQIDTGRTYVRSWDGSGAYNAISNWAPSQLVGAGEEPQLAGGVRGLYLLYRIGKPNRKRYVARRITPTGPGSKLTVSARGAPIFRDFIEDADGNLHATWVDNGDPDKLRYSRSANGTSFSDPKRLAKGRDNVYNPEVGAAGDGGGWVLWMTDTGPSTIKAAPFGPLSSGGSQPCVPKVSYGKAVIIASEGCLQRSGSTYSTTGAVRLNGLDLEPHGNTSAGAAAPTKIVVDVATGRLKSNGKVRATAGNVQLDDAKLAWKLPKGGGAIKDLAGNPATFATGKLGEEFVGLSVLGQTTPQIGDAQSMNVPVHVRLPEPFGSLLGGAVTGDSTLQLDNPSGLKLDNVQVRAKSVFIGIAEVEDLNVDYVSDPFVLNGSARILLPVIKSALQTQFGFRDGDFDHATALLEFDPPGRPVSQFAYLKNIGFQILTDPTKLAGSAAVTAGPTIPVLNVAAARVNGSVSYTFPKPPTPGVFRAQGTGFIVNIPVSNVFAQYETTGKLSFGGNFDLDSGFGPSLSGNVDGVVDLASGGFDLFGNGEGCGIPALPGGCVGVKVLLSKKAAAGCGSASVGPPGAKVSVSAGLAYLWSSGDFEFFGGCDLKPYKSVAAARVSANSATFKISKGLPAASVKIDGEGNPPAVRLTAPDGRTLTSASPPGLNPAENALGSIGPSYYAEASYAVLPKPQPGTWKVDILGGSAEIQSVRVADGLPDVKVRAKVKRRKGRKRLLAYKARKIDGQRIRFFEVGKGVSKRIGTVKGGKGRLRFSAADGPKGKRTIVAAIDSFGLPRARLDVASYKAPGPVKPGKPKRLRAKRKGKKLKLTWRRAKRAKRYIAAIKLRDGRRLALTTKKTSLKVRNVPGIDSAKIKVAGLKADNTPGKAAKAKLKAKPKKRKKRRGKRR